MRMGEVASQKYAHLCPFSSGTVGLPASLLFAMLFFVQGNLHSGTYCRVDQRFASQCPGALASLQIYY